VPREPLPIDDVLPEVEGALRRHPGVVLRAPTGTGKTTRVPPALLDAGLACDGRIVVLEPRRLAARAAAAHMAWERGGNVGGEVGYQVRFDRRYGDTTRILAVTPGILLRHLLDEPYLESAGVVVFDEFHERGLESDLALGMVRLIQQTVRPELRIVVMSATLTAEPVSAYMGGCPVVVSEGRLYRVDIAYEPRPPHRPWPAAAAAAAERLLDRTPGDLLVFLPGLAEIRQAMRHLEPVAATRGIDMVALYGDLPAEQQDAALARGPRRKIVVATNVAETSVTVEGVTGVVDSGLARQLVYDPGVGLDRLRLVPISRSSADQRAGRAGRLAPGVCVRLWGASDQLGRPEQNEPEIRRVDLAAAVLQLAAWGEKDVLRFPWFEPPREAAVAQAVALLERLGALRHGELTDMGRTLARLPVHPRLGRLLVEGSRLGDLHRVALAAALLSERDPFLRALHEDRGSSHVTDSDVLERVSALEAFEATGHTSGPLGNLHRATARAVLRARDQLWRSVRRELGATSRGPHRRSAGPGGQGDEPLLRSLLAAFPDRLARRREPGSRRGVMVGGRGVRLAPASGVLHGELFVCIDVDAGQTEAIVRQASMVLRDWLPAERITTSVEVAFDEQSQRVVARRRVRFDDLVLEEVPAPLPAEDEASRALAAAAAQHMGIILPPPDSAAGLYRLRVRCLRQWMPELGLPALDEADITELLTALCQGRRSFAELRHAPWLEAIQGRLTHAQREAVRREAPERLEVPSGSRIALRYEEGRPPVLAARIQELFGMAQTPRVAAGHVRVLLHLLAPNFRPQQVTDDLESFWNNTYQQVRKELRARYPRHSWPEDPWHAAPQRRPPRRRQP
jgi:ATP-dependent helicase HrpB